ncbi:MAG: GAF domain-containing protein [Deltaproteobacteria bacterium]|nr:GAF domain-containing protein [Deltaproteobacteria bacterium]
MKLKKNKNTRVRDANKTLEVLFEISEAVTTTLNLDELYRAIHKSLGKILNVDNFYIALHHGKKDSITFPYHVDEKDDNPEEIFNFSKTASLTGRIIKARKPLIFFEQDIIDFAKVQKQKTIGTICKIWLGAPLIIKNRVIGVIAIQSFNSPDDYKIEDLNLLNTISQHIALAIERKESEEALKEQQKILKKIVESSPVGICLVENRIFKWVNNEMLNMFGYEKKEDFENTDVRMIYSSEADYKKAGKIIYQDLKDKGKSDFDFDLKRKDGTLFKAHVIMTSSGAENPIESTIVTLADISQRELAQKEKLEREKLQGVLEMAGAVCHEINQPLQTILGYSTLYQDNEAISFRELNNIKNQATRIGNITKRLSNITRYKTMNYPGDTKIVDIWNSSHDAS